MLGNSRNDTGLASAANSELAGIIDIDASFEQHLKDFSALGYEIFLARACELDPEAAHVGPCRIVFRREIFDVDIAVRAARGGGLERLEHRIGAAAIEVSVLRGRRDRGGQIEELAASLVVEMQLHELRIELPQCIEKRHVLARLAGIMELP